MKFRLCLALGSPFIHPDYLDEALTQTQLNDWILFSELEPFGGPTDDFRSAMQAYYAVMTHAGTKTPPLDKFIPQWGERDPMTPEEFKAKVRSVIAAAAPRDAKGK